MRKCITTLTILLMLAGSTTVAGFAKRHRPKPFTDVLEQSRAKYAALKTYSDSGTVTTEYGGTLAAPASVEHFTFVTYYRAPRQFLFDFKGDPKNSDEHLVIWSDETDFNTWWSATKVHEVYPKGKGATAFAVTAFPTKSSAMHLAPLLFSQAGLHGSIVDIKLLRTDPTETINGHKCYKLVGEVALAYGTGAVTDSRLTTIWIDTESLLVRKIFEDTPKGAAEIERVTTTFDPAADPKIDDTKFKFTPPSGT